MVWLFATILVRVTGTPVVSGTRLGAPPPEATLAVSLDPLRRASALQPVRRVREPGDGGRDPPPLLSSQRYGFSFKGSHEVRDAPHGMLEDVRKVDPGRDEHVVGEIDVEGNINHRIFRAASCAWW